MIRRRIKSLCCRLKIPTKLVIIRSRNIFSFSLSCELLTD
jgi:hypothetical protein